MRRVFLPMLISVFIANALPLSLPANALDHSPDHPGVTLPDASANLASFVSKTDTPSSHPWERPDLMWSLLKEKAETVIISTNANPADALASGALQGRFEAPLIYADPVSGLDGAALEEIRRLQPKQAFILGGLASVPRMVEEQLSGIAVKRLAGETRIETALAVAQAIGRNHPISGVLLVRSNAPAHVQDQTAAFGDALGAGALAAATDQVVLLIPHNELVPGVKAFLDRHPDMPVTVVGGEAALTSAVMDAIPPSHETKRLAGESRAETSVALSTALAGQPKGLTLLDGFAQSAWMNGLAAASYTAEKELALTIVHPEYVDEHLGHAITALEITSPTQMFVGPGINRLAPFYMRTEFIPSDFVYIDLAMEDWSTRHMNLTRDKNGTHPVQRHEVLDNSSRQWSLTMLEHNQLSHAPDWGDQINQAIASMTERIFSFPYGENVLSSTNIGSDLGEAGFNSWLRSPGHARNMFNPEYSYVGVGAACNQEVCYATQRFVAKAKP